MHIHVFATEWMVAFLRTDVSLELGKKTHIYALFIALSRVSENEVILVCSWMQSVCAVLRTPSHSVTFQIESLCEYSSLLSFLLANF